MDSLHFLETEQLLLFLHINKTELSCIEKPGTFIRQLRDHCLIPEETFQKVIRMRSKDTIKKALYDLLDYVETKQSQHIHLFWDCIFKETIMNEYPVLRPLQNRLLSLRF